MSMPAELLKSQITLADLLDGMIAAPEIPVTGITDDSRKLRAGNVFLACQGAASHGLDYIEQAVAANVAAIVFDSATGSVHNAPVPIFAVEGLANRLGLIANRWFDFPSHQIRVTGVTGTNGKTTVAYLIQQCMEAVNHKCGYIGTLGTGLSGSISDGSMTTPPCIELHEILAGFRDQGATHAAIEVSSHALEQNRVDGIKFDAAIFTNLSRDHIDYHGTMREYFEAKSGLFLNRNVPNRIVSLDSEFGAELADRCGSDVVTVSTRFDRVANGRPYVFVRAVVATPAGSNISITSSWGSAKIALPLPGDFNVANAAQVLALMLCQDVPFDVACDVLGKVTAPPGRMQPVQVSAKSDLPSVYVDYSHTPASLEAALKALRGHCTGKLWCVFGCGGDRDRGKRPMMGKVARRMSDFPVVTSDNPRTEEPAQIIADVLKGMDDGALAIEDRSEAIAHAIFSAAACDTVLIAGKGHEDYQVIGTKRLDFSDVEVAARFLTERDHAGLKLK